MTEAIGYKIELVAQGHEMTLCKDMDKDRVLNYGRGMSKQTGIVFNEITDINKYHYEQ